MSPDNTGFDVIKISVEIVSRRFMLVVVGCDCDVITATATYSGPFLGIPFLVCVGSVYIEVAFSLHLIVTNNGFNLDSSG